MRFPIFDDLGIGSIDYDHILISFLPNRDKQGKKFSNKVWETRALKLQADLFRGATSYPRTFPSRGSYKTSEGKILIEDTKAILSYVKEEELSPAALKRFSDFLKDFGKKTKQETVAFTLDDQMHYYRHRVKMREVDYDQKNLFSKTNQGDYRLLPSRGY